MAYTYTTIDGQRVQVSVAQAYQALKKAFEAAFPGLTLKITSGTRTRAEQAVLYDKYLHHGGNLAAAPGYSNHEEDGPRGPRALDVRDTGNAAGVTVAGNARSNWLRANASRYGFNPAGYGFKRVEPWHIEFTGTLNNSTGGGSATSGFSQTTANEQAWMNRVLGRNDKVDGRKGPIYRNNVKAYQKLLGLPQDGIWGPNTQKKHQAYYDSYNKPAPSQGTGKPVLRVGSRGDWVKKVQQKLKTNYPAYAGKLSVDGIFGAGTAAAVKEFQRRSGLAADGIVGAATYKKLGL